jgi:hypothetical protein
MINQAEISQLKDDMEKVCIQMERLERNEWGYNCRQWHRKRSILLDKARMLLVRSEALIDDEYWEGE